MKTVYIIIISFIFLSASCKKEEPLISPSTEITLSSITLGEAVYYSYGYSFELQKFVKTLNSPDVIDIYLIEALKVSGEPTGVQFASEEVPESTYGFYLTKQLSNSVNAVQFYNNYTTADAPQFSVLTDTVKVNQVWTFKTWKKNYVKFLVKDIRKIYNGANIDYIEVDIKYFIQRDGSADLTE